MDLAEDIRACRLCAARFAATKTAHDPRPVAWFGPTARILIAGQAPGARVHESGRPFADPSGERLRDWLGLSEAEFYDQSRISIVPMGFCFPGYDARGADIPPPPICARTWHGRVMKSLPNLRLRLLVGAHAQRWHLGRMGLAPRPVTEVVRDWRALPAGVLALPHPSWRNTGWIRKNPWFEGELLPMVRALVRENFHDDSNCT